MGKEARILINKAKESVVKAKSKSPTRAIEDVRASDKTTIDQAVRKENEAERAERREERTASDAQSRAGANAKELVNKNQAQGNAQLQEDRVQMEAMREKDQTLEQEVTHD